VLPRTKTRQLPNDASDVEANAAIAQHRTQVKEDATNAEVSKGHHLNRL
jgi:hypothetical protein